MNDRQIGDFQNIEEVKTQNKRKGQHFFDASTMRFFGSRVGYRIYGGCYFVTSEQDNYGGYARRYTVRVAYACGDIDTVGDFQAYATRAQAVKAIKQLLAEGGSK
jgi:hypothetical protein